MLYKCVKRSREFFFLERVYFYFSLTSFLYFGGIFDKTIIPLALVVVVIYHLISNARSWNNC